MKINGYKAFNADKTNRYGKRFKEGKWYTTLNDDAIKFGNDGNGYHMCTKLCDVFRYFDPLDVVVAEVEGNGKINKHNDDYYGYYDMYSVEDIFIKKFLAHDEIIYLMLNDKFEDNVIKFVKTFPLSDGEIHLFIRKYINKPRIIEAIMYYQINARDRIFPVIDNGIKKVKKYG